MLGDDEVVDVVGAALVVDGAADVDGEVEVVVVVAVPVTSQSARFRVTVSDQGHQRDHQQDDGEHDRPSTARGVRGERHELHS